MTFAGAMHLDPRHFLVRTRFAFVGVLHSCECTPRPSRPIPRLTTKGVTPMISSLRRSLGAVVGASALVLASGTYYSQAQEPARPKSKSAVKKAAAAVEEDEAPAPKTSAKKKSDPARRVYPYFAQLGLTEEQRESIYKIRAKHAPKVDALEKQLEEVRAQALAEAEKVLTPQQRKMLEERRKEVKAAAEAKEKDEDQAKAAGSAEEKPKSKPAGKRRRRGEE